MPNAGCLNRKDAVDFHICKPALEFSADFIEQFNIHLMVKKIIYLEDVSFFDNAVFP